VQLIINKPRLIEQLRALEYESCPRPAGLVTLSLEFFRNSESLFKYTSPAQLEITATDAEMRSEVVECLDLPEPKVFFTDCDSVVQSLFGIAKSELITKLKILSLLNNKVVIAWRDVMGNTEYPSTCDSCAESLAVHFSSN